MRSTRELGHRVAHFSREFDRNFEYQLLRCSVDSFCYYTMGRLFCGKSVANGSYVLGDHGRSIAVNAFSAKYLDLINKICTYWTSASVIITIITVLVMLDDRRNAKFVFAHFDASASGWPSG
jgi:hypothetical protein